MPVFLPFLAGLALAAPSATGFHRLHLACDTATWIPVEARDGEPEDLHLHSPFTRVATVTVGGNRVGTVRPQATAVLTDLPPGQYDVIWSIGSKEPVRQRVDTVDAN